MLPLTASKVSDASDAVWRASRPIRVVTADSQIQATGSRLSARQRTATLSALRADLAVARANVRYLEQRLHSYRVFRFSDALQPSIARTELALRVACRIVDDINAEIRRTARSR
jgi:hypothetical protein